jgi:large subunit ribosomal protein L18e
LKTQGRTDPNKITLIRDLKRAKVENNAKIWASLVTELSKSKRRRITVNLSRINRISAPGDVLLIPGKVLGSGSLNHQLEIAAESFSHVASKKIKNAGGKCFTIKELLKKKPKGSHVRIIK